MSRRGGTGLRATKKPVVVLAGEDGNDRRCLRILLEDFCPQMRGRIVEINDSVRLRDAGQKALTDRVRTLARKVRARAAREQAELACVFVQEDLDDVDERRCYEVRTRVQKALEQVLGTAHYVLSAAEIEAWLLLFPEALTGLVTSWQVPKQYRNRNTGTFNDPKEILTGSVSNQSRRYRESDAPDVFAKAVDLGCLDRPTGTNVSWSRFREDVGECCGSHIPRQQAKR